MNSLSGQGPWTVEATIEEAVAADVITAVPFTRFRSRQDHTFGEKMLDIEPAHQHHRFRLFD